MDITRNNVIDELYGHIFYVDKILWIVTDIVKVSDIEDGICKCDVLCVRMWHEDEKSELDLELKVTNDAEYDDKLYFKTLSITQGEIKYKN